MKKLISLMIGMSLVFGAASMAFAQDKKDDSKSKEKGKKKKKTADAPKKDGGK